MVEITADHSGVPLIYAASLNIPSAANLRLTSHSVLQVFGVVRGNLHGQALEFCGSNSAVNRDLKDYKTGQHCTI